VQVNWRNFDQIAMPGDAFQMHTRCGLAEPR
jgi:hypothetical protein